jgi:hypothetical protein
MKDLIFKPNTVDRAMIAADPAAALIGYLSTIMAVFGLFDRIGLNADQVAILGGAVLGLVATLRVFYERSRRERMKSLESELKKASNSDSRLSQV